MLQKSRKQNPPDTQDGPHSALELLRMLKQSNKKNPPDIQDGPHSFLALVHEKKATSPLL